jgi:tetratricopeptide (TPR) repeat protein
MKITSPTPGLPEEFLENNPPLRLSYLKPVRVLHGGMALVYLCNADEGPWACKQVAVKRLSPETSSVPGASNRFLRECYMWLQLGHHPNVVRALSAHCAEGEPPMIVLEYVPQSLRTFMENRPFRLDTALRMLIEIADGLTYVREVLPGFVHADLKPENVLVADDEIAKITDLGLSRVISKSVNSGTDAKIGNLAISNAAGTPLYMAPEQIRHQGVRPATDIYAIGCIAYELVTGKPAYGTPVSVPNYLMRHLHSKPVRIDILRLGIPAILGDLVEGSLAKSPTDRPSLDGLRQALRRLAADAGIVVPDPVVKPLPLASRTVAAQGLLNIGFTEEARLAASRLVGSARDDQEALPLRLIIARSYGEERKYALAEHELDEIARFVNDDMNRILRGTYFIERGRVANGQGDPQRALRYINESIRSTPGASAGYVNAANILWYLGEVDKAIDMMIKALNIAGNIHYFEVLIDLFRQADRLEEALDACDRMVAMHAMAAQPYILRSAIRIEIFGRRVKTQGKLEMRMLSQLCDELASDLKNAVRFGADPEPTEALRRALDEFRRLRDVAQARQSNDRMDQDH